MVNSIVWPRTAAITSYTARGFNTAEIDLSDCSINNFRNFDTYGSSTYSDALAAYITGLPPTTVLVGVTADEASVSLTQAAKDTLLSIGVNVTQLQYRDKVAFIAQVDRPSVAVMNTTKHNGNNARLNAVVSRMYTCVN
jgi:dTDP-4-dehydrorhamnose reductase